MRHTISVLVENKFGVLTRISGLFSGRGFNIDKLNVALRAALGDSKVHDHIATEGAEPLPTSPDEYAADIDREEIKWSVLVKKSGAQAK
jgi:hypothetical protein